MRVFQESLKDASVGAGQQVSGQANRGVAVFRPPFLFPPQST